VATWLAIWHTLLAEFSDIPDITQFVRISLRLLLAALLGGMLGYERERKGKAAGLRTHMLVALGAAFFVLIPQQAGVANSDLTRVIQGVIVGIGFLGAGTIIKLVEKAETHGLTTAASIWLTAAIGVAAGAGRAASALLATFIALIILALLPRFERQDGNTQA
jgi:putative Mg2+ transporter-C (MgtC) family protein